MKIKLVSLFKVAVIAFFMLSMSSAYAEYYLVYEAPGGGCGSCVVRHHYAPHRYHHTYHHPRYQRHYYSKQRTRLDMRVYYVWRVYPAPGCNTGCNSGCKTRYYAASDGYNSGYYSGNYYNSGCNTTYSGNCYRSAKPGMYKSCNTGCENSGYSGDGRYVNTYDTNNDYNYDTRTRDDY